MKILEFDARGMICPTPIFEAEKLFADLSLGDMLTIYTDSELVGYNLMDWAEGKGIEPDMVQERDYWKVLVKIA